MDPKQPPRYFNIVSISHCNNKFQFKDFQFQVPQMGRIHPDHLASKALRSVLPHDTFIMSPLLEGQWIKISGTDGFVGPDWRNAEDAEIVKLTRTLDAFQHFTVVESNNRLIITDLQGMHA
jgi:hypothetical protein